MTQHTQGEWKVFNRGDQIGNTYARYRIEHSDENLRSVIADINPSWLCPEHGDAQANARLIAAALAEASKNSNDLAKRYDIAVEFIKGVSEGGVPVSQMMYEACETLVKIGAE